LFVGCDSASDPTGKLKALPRPPSWILGGLLLRERRKANRERRKEKGKGEGEGRD